jgi:hypothetical protein
MRKSRTDAKPGSGTPATPVPDDSTTTVHQWRVGLDKYSFNLEHWVQVPDEHGGLRFLQKSSDTQYFSTLEQLARAMRDRKFRAYFKDGLSIQAALDKSTQDILAFFRGETEFVEAVIKTDLAKNLIREQASSEEDEDVAEEEEDEE